MSVRMYLLMITCSGYAIKFFLCEILALFNVIGMIYFTDRFLGHQFTTVSQHRARTED